MNTLKKKKLHLAVIATLSTELPGAQAVIPDLDGFNQEFLSLHSNISIKGKETKSVKIKFLEGKNSREVLDFNLFLSPPEVWKEPLVFFPKTDSFIPHTLIYERERVPQILAIVPSIYFPDHFPKPSLDRAREGYFEIIDMEQLKL